ncbi:MAG TPA: hypothetical protein VIY48_13580, partial [Candidatus Paceibacterota bacterium]
MSAKLSLWSLNNHSRLARGIRLAAISIGAFAVIWGAADVASRISRMTFGDSANLQVFGPAAAIQNPSVLNSAKSTNASATSTGDQATTTPFTPARLKIPSIGVD